MLENNEQHIVPIPNLFTYNIAVAWQTGYFPETKKIYQGPLFTTIIDGKNRLEGG